MGEREGIQNSFEYAIVRPFARSSGRSYISSGKGKTKAKAKAKADANTKAKGVARVTYHGAANC